MPDIGNAQKGFLDQATQEQSFRKQIINGLIQVLKNPKTTPSLRLLIVSALVTALGVSVVFCIFLGIVIHSLCTKTALGAGSCIWAIVVLFVLFMGLAIVLAFKASPIEQSLRLEDSFDRIYKKRLAS